ncbi:hypothetical protein, partial [Pseudomonas viridiflava]|uniref:hypothetical protein n=1 Tax=Pseudomonas viridiflava TaxID=33069 RepID=UPI0019CF7958
VFDRLVYNDERWSVGTIGIRYRTLIVTTLRVALSRRSASAVERGAELRGMHAYIRAMGTISVEADLCITLSGASGEVSVGGGLHEALFFELHV